MSGLIIHINGWPGAGKKTIGTLLAERLQARFIHNHLLHDVAIVCGGGLETNERWVLYEQVRAAAYDALLKRPQSELFVMTNALTKETQREVTAWYQVVDLAISRQVPLLPVVLEVSPEENMRRVQSVDRIGRKLAEPQVLQSIISECTLQYPDVEETLVFDVTDLEPATAAAQLEMEISRRMIGLKPASPEHLVFR